MSRNSTEFLFNQYDMHDLGFYNPGHVNLSRVSSRNSIVFPVVADSYRVANVVISDTSPIITFRLMAMDEVCICNELFLQLIYLEGGSVYCSLIGNDRFSNSTKYFGDITLTREDLLYSSPIDITLMKLLSKVVVLEESKTLVSKYLHEGIFYNKACSELKDSILHNSNLRG